MANADIPQRRLTDRNRVNQRNFRARRQSYVKELEQRVRKLETDGISATKEVQIAAQQVNCENRLLKWLLEIQFGVSRYHIDKYLQETACHPDACTPRSSRQTNVEYIWLGVNAPLPSLEPVAETKDDVATPSECDPVAARSAHAREENAPEPRMLPRFIRSPSEPVVSTIELEHVEPHPRILHRRSAGAPGNQSVKDDMAHGSRPGAQLCVPSSASHLIPCCCAVSEGVGGPWVGETSCEEAANILANLRGQDAHEDVWHELGCGERRSCGVTNLSIFELMDRERPRCPAL
ncbi:hypothetical protein LTR99_011167 [Exophiala xenobiotica]|uniref:BZIP domain-containing protein n=2 Tax=leotiomyceta TaxID=716546 RepID=A0A0D2DKY1_9EURO|nr:uncharacterized protein PV06_11335 [Exophiala oligosperma]KAJ9493535.1 hypothetical protein H2202_011004 [Exophiala xenobiotica]KAK5527486.1 hypothetical protein LTR25_011164 [Vermiconidia calcicola]KAK5527722.1 hypothetical protein LTR23_011213 [Chaetothyriales sp. CCFEE 6169]KAK5188350.1 hypothetical protein LTR92_011580 [Exophiala xenobiotica]KAK5290119.1 hypothetical protein LTR99_011167 [Exophiala xenobiotica]